MQKLPIKATFFEMYMEYQTNFKNEYSREKFKEVFDTVTNSPTIGKLISASQNQNAAPVGKDFTNCILSMRYFIFAKNDTRAMGAIIALYIWNEQVNVFHNYSDIRSLYNKIEDIFGNLGMF